MTILLFVGLSLKTEFITAECGGTWRARIRADSQDETQPILASLILYIYNEDTGEMNFINSQKVEGYTGEV